jgi:hypothetical protein
MAITQLYTAVPNDVITAARWNNEFGNIYNNGTAVAFPVTTAVSFGGFSITLDVAGVTTLTTSASQGFILTPGVKSGAPNTTGKFLDLVASTFTDTNTAGSGTVATFAAHAFQRPSLVATNASVTTTDAANVYIPNSPLASTNETITNAWSLFVDAGNVRLDGQLNVQGDAVLSENPYRFTATVAGNALTITLQDTNGNTPTASSPIPLAFRNATLTTPQRSTVLVTAATTLTISSGSTLGTINAFASRIWIGALNNAGTVELFAYNSLKMVTPGTGPQTIAGPSIKGLHECDLITTTAEGGAGAADSNQVPYSTTARSNVAFRWLGYVESTQATAGTWATSPSKVQMYYPGIPKPGDRVQRQINYDNNVATGTTAIPDDNTTPTLSEGDQYMSQAITPTFAGNILHVHGLFTSAHSVSVRQIVALNDGTTTLAVSIGQGSGAAQIVTTPIEWMQIANQITALTYNVRAGSTAGATMTFNGEGGNIRFNVVFSHLCVDEIAI